MRTFLRIIGWLLAIEVFILVALVAATVWLYRHYMTSRTEQARIARERRDAEIRGLANVDPAGRCGWCGGVHTEHPAIFHAVSVVERIENIAA